MRVCGYPKAFYHLARHQAPELSAEAEERLRWLKAWGVLRAKGCTAQEAAAVLELAVATLYRWQGRLKRDGPRGLEPKSRRPQHMRQPRWPLGLILAVRQVREGRPRWGKVKLGLALRDQGWRVSAATVGRILTSLRRRGQLHDPPLHPHSATRRRLRRPYGVRKPRAYRPTQPGDLVQLDTVDLRPLPGVVLKQFTAVDVVSRWSVVAVRTRATATTATQFLVELQARMGGPVRALQVDGGSEFMAEFEAACQQQDIRLFVLPPHSPKLNGCVERANRTHQEEFWECYDGALDLPAAQRALLDWERVYNTQRPHQALDYRTPLQYLRECHPVLASTLSHMY